MLCSFCKSKESWCKGLCAACYNRQRRTGTLEYKPRPLPRKCKFEGCDKINISKGFCDTHRKRIDRHGDVYHGRPDWWGLPFNRRKSDLKRKYGLEYEKYLELKENQAGRCAICMEEKPLTVDHCHNTNKIRGLLCHKCNKGIGLFNDSPERMRSAAEYCANV